MLCVCFCSLQFCMLLYFALIENADEAGNCENENRTRNRLDMAQHTALTNVPGLLYFPKHFYYSAPGCGGEVL